MHIMLNATLCTDRCRSNCKTYILPSSSCYNPAQRYPADPQWGQADIYDDLINATHVNRSFFATRNGSCRHRTDGFVLPLDACIGPFGKPRPFGTITLFPVNNRNEDLCRAHVLAHAKDVRRKAQGALPYPYLVPSGPYDQLWDWDAVFLGVATLRYGNRAYLAGSMRNFFDATNLSTGAVTGCLTREPPVVCSSSRTAEHDALVHAKPILVQGAWLAANAPDGSLAIAQRGSSSKESKEEVNTEKEEVEQADGSVMSWERHAPAMEALLSFWERPPRRDAASGLHTWHDQLESGADNGVLSKCASARSPSCWTASQAYSLASPDVQVLLQREHTAAANFYEAWAEGWERAATAAAVATAALSTSEAPPNIYAAASDRSERASAHREAARRHRRLAHSLHETLNTQLWREELGYHIALNVSSRELILAKTFAIAYPLWARLVNQSQAASIARVLGSPEMISVVGLRSASSQDPRYSNADTILPYSNWRGPAWVHVNAMACYGLAAYGFHELAFEIASRITAALAADLQGSQTHTWHEAYSTADGAPIGGRGFLSWDTLSADLMSNLRAGIDPMHI